jgi:hypothetical protein
MKRGFLALAAALALPSVAVAKPETKSCDRACLTALADSYVAAMVAHDPKQAPLAANLVTVENLKRIQPGDGLWNSLSGGASTFKIVVPDETAQQVGYMAIMQEGGKPIQVGLRLKLVNGKIVEAEHLVVHQLTENNLKNLQTPRAAFGKTVPDAYRDSRGRLLTIAASYYDALDENNGSLAPFADDCARFENGLQTARNPVPPDPEKSPFNILGALGCAAQLDTQLFTYITRIDNRRVWIADEQTGIAFGLSHFRHAQVTKKEKIIGVPGVEERTINNDPFDLPAIHIYKIWGGKIHEIEAMGFVVPYQSPTGWEQAAATP